MQGQGERLRLRRRPADLTVRLCLLVRHPSRQGKHLGEVGAQQACQHHASRCNGRRGSKLGCNGQRLHSSASAWKQVDGAGAMPRLAEVCAMTADNSGTAAHGQ